VKRPTKIPDADTQSNVVPLRPASVAKRESEAKWGKNVMDAGYCIVPAVLFRAQARLGLSGMQLVLLLQLHEYWWKSEQLPFPKKETLVKRMGISEKQVQRLTKQLEDAGYIKRIVRKNYRGQTSNRIEFTGLVKKLKELAPEFTLARQAGRKVEQRGGLKAKTA
jgi:DNA-binding MarR family transcriptional regulator